MNKSLIIILVASALFLAVGVHSGCAATISFSSQVIPGGVRLSATEEVSSYFILQGSSNLGNLQPLAMDLGVGGAVWDQPITAERQFWAVRQVSVYAPEDTDGDFIDDLYEIQHPGLNPLNAADASVIVPGKTISYLEEYRQLFGLSSDPAQVYSREVSSFNFGGPMEAALSREVSVFNFSDLPASSEAISREVSVSNSPIVDFLPTDVTGSRLHAFYSPDTGFVTSLVGGNNLIAQWTDGSGNGNHALPPPGTGDVYKPRTQSRLLNGQPVVVANFGWAGAPHRLEIPSLPPPATKMTIIGVVRRSSTGGILAGWIGNNNLFANLPIDNTRKYCQMQIVGEGGGYDGSGRRPPSVIPIDQLVVHSLRWHGPTYGPITGYPLGSPWDRYVDTVNGMATTRAWAAHRTWTDKFVLGTTHGSAFLSGDVVACAVFKDALTPSEEQAIERTFAAKYGAPTGLYPPRPNIIMCGNSISAGNPYSWFEQTIAALDEPSLSNQSRITGINSSVGGQNLVDMLARLPMNVFPFHDPSAPVNLAAVWEGTNSFGAFTAEETLAQTRSVCLALRSAGFAVLVMDTFGSSAVANHAAWDARRTAYNSLLAQHWSEFADFFEAPSAWSEFIPDGTNLWDGLHPSAAGAGYIQAHMQTVFTRCLNQGN